ncbi:FAD-dependent oxidoreductase [Desulfosarcina sp.]|uniref:FAD-dependent oxidoreductase n=1 Tax=Desulfosarcina sp. TaxID=2027861 RepID=UPI00356205B9
MEKMVIIGGGIGGAIAHDLALRGFSVVLLEKGELCCGSTGRHHGLLHSGARYALHDVATAAECMTENRILRAIAPQAVEQNDGLFVAVDDADMNHYGQLIRNCSAAGIPSRELSAVDARRMEPELSPTIKAAVQVPDATMDAWRLAMHFFASAKANGADIRPFSEVVGLLVNHGAVTGVKVRDHHRHATYIEEADMVINATGPWAGKIAALLDIHLPMKPSPGVMVSMQPRLTGMVINRLHPAGKGDIVVPQRNQSILGTSAWIANDPDEVTLPADHVRQMIDLCSRMLPKLAHLPVVAAWSASRPLLVGDAEADPTRISRASQVIDHGLSDGVEGMLSVVGGKATTMRAMAEKVVDRVCAKTGRAIPCTTKHTVLTHYRRFFRR